MADQLPLPLDEEPFYLTVHLLTPWGPVEIDQVPVNDARVDPLDRRKVATGLAYVSIGEAQRLLEGGRLTQDRPG